MGQLVQVLKLSDGGYSQGLKKAIEAVKQLGEANGVSTQGIANVTREMRSAKKYAESLAATYNQLSKEAKNTDWGKQMAKEMEAAIQKAGQLQDLRGDIQRQIKNVASDTRIWDTAREGVAVFAGGLQLASGAIGAFADNQEQAVKMLNMASAAQGTLNTITALGNALQKESNIMRGIAAMQAKAEAIGEELVTAAKVKGTIATKAATVAQAAFNAVAKMNPYLLIATACVAAAGAIYAYVSATEKSAYQEQKEKEALEASKKELMNVSEYYDKTGRSVEKLADIQKEQPALWKQLTQEAAQYKEGLKAAKAEHDKLGEKAGDLISKFSLLQVQWKNLRTEAEKRKFIDDNKNAFNQLGLSVNNLNDAYNVLVKNAPAVISALKAMAEAEAMKDLYKDSIKKRETEWNNRNKSTSTGDFYTKANDSNLTDAEKKRYGKSTSFIDQAGNRSSYTDYDYNAINKEREQAARDLNAKQKKYYDDEVDHYEKRMTEAMTNVSKQQQNLSSKGIKWDGSGKVTTTKHTKTSTKNTNKNTSDKETAEEKYANTLAQIADSEKRRMYDSEDAANNEKKAVEEKIKATEAYIKELQKDKKSIEKNKTKIDSLNAKLTSYTARIKTLNIQVEDNKIIKTANEEYAKTIEKLNREREQNWVTEDDYNDRYINALKALTDKYKTVTNLNDDLIKTINVKQKEVENLSLAKEWKKADVAVTSLIEDFHSALAGVPEGNSYYNQKQEARSKVDAQKRRYGYLESSSMMWSNLQTKQDKADWIKNNNVAATQLGVPNFDVDVISRIGDVSKASAEDLVILEAAIQQLENVLSGDWKSKWVSEMQDIIRTNVRYLDGYAKQARTAEEVLKMAEGGIDAPSNKSPRDLNGRGDNSNYSLHTRSNANIQKQATTFNSGRGGITNFQQNDITDNLNDQLQELLAMYTAAQDKLVEINSQENTFGLNIDIAGLEGELDQLGKQIDGVHDEIQKRLTFQVRMEGINNTLNGLNSIASFGSSLDQLGESWERAGENCSAFGEAMNKASIVITTLQGAIAAVNTVLEICNALQNIATAGAIAKTAADTADIAAQGALSAEKTADIAPTVAQTAANKALEASILDLAAANIFAAHASVPFAGVGIATGMVAEMMAAMTTQHGASATLAAFANGGIVSEGNFHGDTTLIRANKGEMILNSVEQKNLFDMLKYGMNNPMQGGLVEFKISGDSLYGTLKNHKKIKGKTGHSITL